MANTVQLTKNGQPVFPVTDVSLVMGLQDAIKLPPVKVATLPTASADTAGKMYYVGPTDDEYERYITSAVNGSYEWIDLGNTAIPLPSIADNLTTDDANTALAAAQGKVLDGKISQLAQKVDGLQEKSGKVVIVNVPTTAGAGISNNVIYPIYIKAGTATITLDSGASAIIGNTALPFYKVVNGVKSYWYDIKAGTTKTLTVAQDIEGIAFYMVGSSVLASGTLSLEVRQNGELDAEIANTKTIAERKVEKLAYIGPNSSGHTWAIGEKFFNTSLKKLRICKSASPVDFYPDYNPSAESLYLYDNTIYEWNGNDMVEVASINELQFRSDNGFRLKRYYSYRDFVVGNLYKGQVTTSTQSVCTPQIQTAACDMILTAESGYRFSVHYFNGDTYTTNIGWITTSLKIDKGTRFRLMISSADGSITPDTISFVRKCCITFVDFNDNTIELKIFGKYAQSFQSTQGVGIDGTKLRSDYCLRLKIENGETFTISLSGSITSGMTFYALKADGTAQSINKNTYGYYVAPFDMEGIGVYIAGASVQSTGTYSVTVEDISIEDIKHTVYGRGVLPYWGQKLPSLSVFNRTNRCKEEILISENNTNEGNDNRNAAGLVVYGDRIFSFNDGNYCMVFDKTTLELLEKSILPWSSHNNNAQPTPYFYDAGDDFPLFLVSRGDYSGTGEQKFYFVRVIENNGSFTFSIVKSVSYSGFIGEQYNCSWFANYEKNELYAYTYPNGGWNVEVNNPIIIHKFRMPSMDNYDDVTLTGTDLISTITMLDHWTMQSCLYHDDKIFMQASRGLNDTGITINGEPYDKSKGVCFLFIVDPDSGYIETIVPLNNYIEQEGMCVCDGALYMSEKYSLAPVGSLCFRIMKYTFD